MNNGYSNTFGLNTIPSAMRGNQQIVGGNNQLVSGNQYYSGGQQQSFYPQPVNFGQPQQNINSISSNEANTNIIWMQGGENTVKSTMMPNSTQYAFFEQDGNKFYIKTVDQYGKSSVEPYIYFPENEVPQILLQGQQTDVSQSVPMIDTSAYVTQEQFLEMSDQLTKQIQEISKRLNDFKSRVGNMNKKENSK